jgi:conserved domain protein|nr:MAG TPA: SPP1 phage holin [Caudoviricetes sp.]
MGYMLLGAFLVAGSMGALEVDQIGWEQFILQSLIGLIISLYGFYKDKAVMDAEEQEDVAYISRVRTHGDYCKNPYYN